MKKTIIFFLILLSITIESCNINHPGYLHFKKKPNIHYYSDNINSNILSNKNYTVYIFNTNFFKKISIEEDDKEILHKFFYYLNNESYKPPQNIELKEKYQIRLEFEDEKYIINIYDNTLVSVFPWDGIFEKDIIFMDNIPLKYNLYDFCIYIEKKDLLKNT